ncbi:MAG TPA: toll/interleukin-1 receptor domain-containing protein [Bryobacteraceae bacterium]
MKIFLSHASEDRVFVNTLALDLKGRGFDVWYSEWELGVGDSLASAIQRGIREASWLVVVLSPDSVRSRWVREELNAGFARQLAEERVYILPVLHKDCEIPIFLRDWIYADFRTDYSSGLQKLLWTLTLRYHPPRAQSDSELSWWVDPGLKLRQGGDGEGNRKVDSALKGLIEAFDAVGVHDPPYVLPRVYALALVANRADRQNPNANSLAGLWRGLTGRLRLSISGRHVHGEYDWLGYDYSELITGRLKNDVVRFDWSWPVSGARGAGVFYRRSHDSLTGGWWFKYEEVDIDKLVSSRSLPPRHGSFFGQQP